MMLELAMWRPCGVMMGSWYDAVDGNCIGHDLATKQRQTTPCSENRKLVSGAGVQRAGRVRGDAVREPTGLPTLYF